MLASNRLAGVAETDKPLGPRIVGVSAFTSGTGTTTSVTLPPAIARDDLIVVMGGHIGQLGAPSATGMTNFIAVRNGSDQEVRLDWFGEVAGGGEGGSTRTITWANSADSYAVAFVIRNAGFLSAIIKGSGNIGSESGDFPDSTSPTAYISTGAFDTGPRYQPVLLSATRPIAIGACIRDGSMAFDGYPTTLTEYRASLVGSDRGMAVAAGHVDMNHATGALTTISSAGSFTWTGTEEWVTGLLLVY